MSADMKFVNSHDAINLFDKAFNTANDLFLKEKINESMYSL